MRDPAGHIAPGRHPLRRDELRHIVEGNHIALARALIRAPFRHPHQQALQPPTARYPHFFLNHRIKAILQFTEKRRKFRNAFKKRAALALVPARSSSRTAERFRKSIRPSASSPITPEVTEESTESNSRRRSSVWWTETSASRWPRAGGSCG